MILLDQTVSDARAELNLRDLEHCGGGGKDSTPPLLNGSNDFVDVENVAGSETPVTTHSGEMATVKSNKS